MLCDSCRGRFQMLIFSVLPKSWVKISLSKRSKKWFKRQIKMVCCFISLC
uniref:Uncharacterized protein n=1 Tax=Aegilops tauschii subsp. strangulata TaxID=200361 RepID=A0A453B2R6_AEGTS